MVSAKKLKDSKTRPIPLYTYHSTELSIIFVYGSDMKRQQKSIYASLCGNKSVLLCLLFHLLAAAALCYLRRRERLPHDGYILCWIDVFAAFVGGGTIRTTHRLERWLFGLIYIGSFFLVAIWGGLVFYPAFYERDHSVESIKEIAEINPPIFIHPDLTKFDEDVADLLRFV